MRRRKKWSNVKYSIFRRGWFIVSRRSTFPWEREEKMQFNFSTISEILYVFFCYFFCERIPLLSGEVELLLLQSYAGVPFPKRKHLIEIYISHPISLPSTRMNSLSLPPHSLFTERRKRQRNVVRRKKKKAKSLRENRGKFSFFFLIFLLRFRCERKEGKSVLAMAVWENKNVWISHLLLGLALLVRLVPRSLVFSATSSWVSVRPVSRNLPLGPLDM